MSGLNRKQTLRIDCPKCKGNGYTNGPDGENSCEDCGGVGMKEKEVPYKFDTMGKWSKDEIATEFGVESGEVSDAGHSTGD